MYAHVTAEMFFLMLQGKYVKNDMQYDFRIAKKL